MSNQMSDVNYEVMFKSKTPIIMYVVKKRCFQLKYKTSFNLLNQ